MIPPIFATLSANAGVTAIIGAGDNCRCYPFGFAKQGTVIPYVTWMKVSGQPLNRLSKGSFTDRIRAQVDCWAADSAGALALARAVRTALETTSCMVSLNLTERDIETRLYRYSMDFEFQVNRQPLIVPPVADFIGSPLSGNTPLNVTFNDLSANSPTSWAWDFGDGGTSISQNPTHSYASAGTYTVSLAATNAGGSDSETKSAYVVADPEIVAVPSGFGWTPPVTIYKNGSVYSTDYDPTPFLVEGDPGVTTYYVDADTGVDANPGTAALPKKTLTTITGGRVTKLLIKARGTFSRSSNGLQVGHDNLCVEAWGGAPCIITTETDSTAPYVWTDEGGGVWSAPSPATIHNGHRPYLGTDVETLVPYVAAANLSACIATPGSWFRDTSAGIKHYIHTSDGSSPATGHRIYGNNGSACSYNASSSAFIQRLGFYGISFHGGDAAFLISGTNATYAKRIDFVNCFFKRAGQFAAMASSGNTTIINYNSIPGPSSFDGFSYTTPTGAAGGGAVPNAIEINCTGRYCGNAATGANQGSTTHFGGQLIRVNGNYHHNADDQVADVGAGTRSWNLGCTFGPKGIGSGKSGAQAGNDATDIRMWFDGCAFTSLDYGWSAASGATIYYKNMTAPSTNPASTGTITTY